VLKDFLNLAEDTMPRTQIVANLWKYIKDNDLQNPDCKREIFCDDAMKKVFRRPMITMFSMNKYLRVHLKSQNAWESGDRTFDYSVLDLSEEDWNEKMGESKTAQEKRERVVAKKNGELKKRGGFPPVEVSKELSAFLGGSRTATRAEVVAKLWVHIREHGLQDENNRRRIICDSTLKSLLGVDECTQFSINKYIQKHFLKKS